MAEKIIGVGQQSDLAVIAEIIEAEIRRTYGGAKLIAARASGIEMQAQRKGFDGPFDSYKIRISADPETLAALGESAQSFPPNAAVTEEEGVFCIEFLKVAHHSAASMDAVKEISGKLLLPDVWRFQGERFRREVLRPHRLMEAMVKFRASDLHLYPDADPVFRVDNAIRRSDLRHPLTADQITAFIKELAPEKDWNEYLEHSQCSFRYHQIGVGFARVSAFIRGGVPHCTLRFLPEVIPSFDELQIPSDVMKKLGGLHFGLVLVTGMTGSGKSTTVASLIDWINQNQARHILTIEDPIEYAQVNKKSIVSQRQVGEDVESFNEAVRAALRQDPDVIFVGEMRDSDTIRSAISAAATGHLVISTLHANTASEVITRIVSFFDPIERDLVRLQLRDCVKCIICQRLVAKSNGGRVPALEFLFNDTKQIADCILSGDAQGIRAGMQQVMSESFIVEKYLVDLAKQDVITHDEAVAHAANHDTFEQMWHGNYAPPTIDSIKQH
ncbi:PilT/PilU family type 4a pilus ATPase [Stieleria sp. ICT_E10.1]|uniref:type IV pilus twitching motility protein PilT n=1 Tax=Stieleria sedimenti TaxID=2976331 RepID=UPI00217FE93E|nr:PilT/PilU family type 4a pilus ATPase [Stieleria sedimenti]MCS7468231.1 PilT/PilU family type 4a pilus ATPase [Stieleria sedimenti]